MVAGAPGNRRKRRRLPVRWAIRLLLVFLAVVPLPAGAAVIPSEDPGIRVGVYHAPPFCGIGDDGTVGSALLLAGCFFGGFLLLRREVARRTEELQREVEKRRRAETAFAESERRFKAALKHSPVFVFHQDRQLTYTWVFNAPGNRAPDTFLGRTDADLFLPEDAALLTRLKRQVLESGSDVKAEIPVTLDGESRRFSLTLEPERDREGDVGGLIGVVIDTTEKARQEEQIREALHLIDRNFEQLATLNDHIRNPLQVIVGLAAMTEGRTAEIILAQSEEINDLVRKLDLGWLESMKIREFLVRHYAPPEDE